MHMKPVETSSHLAAVGHDPATQTMRIRFKSGAIYEYPNVPAEKHAELVNAKSIGSHFHKHFRNNPDHPPTEVKEESASSAAA